MSNTPSLKREFEKYSIGKAYLARLGEKFRLELPQDFDYFVIDTTKQVDYGESYFYEIILTKKGEAEPVSVIKVKRFVAPRLDVFDRKVGELTGSTRQTRNPIDQDAVFLPYFGQVQVYDHLEEHNLLLLEKWCDKDGNESLEERLLDFHRLYNGGSHSQREDIRRRVLNDLIKVINLTIENSERATIDFNKTRSKVITSTQDARSDSRHVFYSPTGELRINVPNQEFFIERIDKYLESIFYIMYYQARRLIDPITQGVVSHPIEDNRLVARQAEFLEKIKLDQEYKKEAALLAGNLMSTNAGIVHFDTRSPNIIVRDGRVALCDYEKISYAARAIDQVLIINDPIVNGFDITSDEKIKVLANAGLNEGAITDASLWAILRLAGAQAMLQLYHPDKYRTVTQNSDLYNNELILDANLVTLDELLRKSRKYPHLQGVINFIQEAKIRWTRRTSPVLKQRRIEDILKERKQARPREPNNTHNKDKVPA